MRLGWIAAFVFVGITLAGADSRSNRREYSLTPENGPVLVRVASFIGADGAETAEKVAEELRTKHRLDAYTYCYQEKVEQEKWTAEQRAAFEEQYNVKPRLPKLKNPPKENWVVFAGNFKSIEDPAANALLKRIRKMRLASLPQDARESFALRRSSEAPLSPLATAMLTFNPIRPRDGDGVAPAELGRNRTRTRPLDSKVAKMLVDLNDDPQYSIYNVKQEFTIEVFEFRGLSVADDQKADSIFNSKKVNGLEIAAKNAIALCDALRLEGYDCYVFHGQYASIVCIGGYRANDPKIMTDLQLLQNKTIGQGSQQMPLRPRVIRTPRRPAQA